MREIKFRAWIDGFMYFNHSVTIQIDGTVAYLTTLGDWIDDTEGVVKLMQYTGLKDKNGVEIYEGDFIKLLEYKDVYKPVIFSGGSFCVHGFNWQPWNCEVIGNIYETPELNS